MTHSVTNANTCSAPDFVEDFEQMLDAEQNWIDQRREAVGIEPSEQRVGLAFSGGGIRSATFNLGVLQALEKTGLMDKVDYLSSVSGGGYIASCYSWLKAQQSTDAQNSVFKRKTEGANGTVLDWIRSHDKYLIDGRGFTGWTLAASILAGVLLNLLVILPPVLFLIGAAGADFLPFTFPAWLHLPNTNSIAGHDGFSLLLAVGIACLTMFLVTIVAFAIISGVSRVRSLTAVLKVRQLMGVLLAWGLALVVVGTIPVVVAIDEAALHYIQSDLWSALAKHATYGLPILSGLVAVFRADKKQQQGQYSKALAPIGLALLIYGLLLVGYHIAVHEAFDSTLLFVGLLGVSLCLATVCDINWVSMHSYYTSRIASAYLPCVQEGSAKPRQFKMSDIAPDSGAPFHIINTTMNTTSSNCEKSRSRGGENFIFTPLYCGSQGTGYRSSSTYHYGRATLSTACTISGAAVDPNTIFTRSRPVAFLMSLLNFRLGYWSSNPRHTPYRFVFPWWYLFIGREMLGIGLNENRRHVHLSDGGQFDNLGLYALVRRRCKHIIVCDAGADPDMTLMDLGQVVQRARADFGAEIDIKADGLFLEREKRLCDRPFAIGSVHYADGSSGEILFIKPLMCAGLTVDVQSYWRQNPAFPNQSTANQFFSEQQFNAYRELGKQIFSSIATPRHGDLTADSICGLFTSAREKLLLKNSLSPVEFQAGRQNQSISENVA